MTIVPITLEDFCDALAEGQEVERIEDGEATIVALEDGDVCCVYIHVASGGCYQLTAA